MINIELGEYYGCENEKEMMEAINTCRELGMSDAEINEVLKRSKHDGEKESDRMENIKASDIQPDDEWMQENEWDEIYAKDNLPDINVGNIKESEE